MARTPSIYVVKFHSGGTSQTFTKKAAATRFAKRLGGGTVVKARNPQIKLSSRWTTAKVRRNSRGKVEMLVEPVVKTKTVKPNKRRKAVRRTIRRKAAKRVTRRRTARRRR